MTAPRIDDGAPLLLRVMACRIVSTAAPCCKGERDHHGGVAGDGLDVAAGLAAVDEDFARRAVGDRIRR